VVDHAVTASSAALEGLDLTIDRPGGVLALHAGDRRLEPIVPRTARDGTVIL
jgi:hypothetical protein